jgi:hypothetical protein
MFWIDGIKLINKAIEKRSEQREWDMWISVYPDMDKKTFISFEKFKNKIYAPKQTQNVLTKNEIIEKSEEIRKLHQGKHEGVK